MRKTALWMSIAIVAGYALGCSSDDAKELVKDPYCVYGTYNGRQASCECYEHYSHGRDGRCTACGTGYSLSSDGTCVPGVNGSGGVTPGQEGEGGNTSEPVDQPVDGMCSVTFAFSNQYTSKGSGGTDDFDVYLVGSFNMNGTEWIVDDENYKMKSDGRGHHTITLKLKMGETYDYKFYVKGWGDDSYQTGTSASGNNVAYIKDCSANKFYHGDFYDGGDGGGGLVITPNKGINLESVNVSGKTVTLSMALDEGYSIKSVRGGSGQAQFSGNVVTDTVPSETKYAYFVTAENGTESTELYVPVWVESQKFDWQDAVLYFTFTDRFVDGDSSNNNPVTNATDGARWNGGDFKGLKQKVDDGYFESLGVNTLWISSVSMNAQGTSNGTNGDIATYSAYHSYWPVATFMTADNQAEFTSEKSEGVAIQAIEPHFGTLDDLKSLVDACHRKGIRVLVDFAANHVHRDSPVYKKHNDWFYPNTGSYICDNDGNWDNKPESCWFSQDLPDINYELEAPRSLMVEHAKWLIRETNIDGFRVDAVKHMNIQFIRDLRSGVESLLKNTGITFYMVGETYTGDVGLLNKYIGNDLLHAQFDFPMYFAIRDMMHTGNVSSIAYTKNTYNSKLMGTFLGNHDVARAISAAAGHNEDKWGLNPDVTDWQPYLKLKLAWTFLFTTPGVPLIYYGDEFGMPGSNDPDNRRMMRFFDLNDQQQLTLEHVRQLGQLRMLHSAMRRGTRTDLDIRDTSWCYSVSDGSETIIVGLASDACPGDDCGCALQGEYHLLNLFRDEEITVSGLDLRNEKIQVYLVK